MRRKRSTIAATTTKGNVDASGGSCVPVKLNDELRRSMRRKRREESAKRKEATRQKKSKRSSPHFGTTVPNLGHHCLTEGEGDISWAGGDGEARVKDECPPTREKSQGAPVATEHTPPSHEKGKQKGIKRTKKLKIGSPYFKTQFEALSKPAKESRKTRAKKSKSTSPHFHTKVKEPNKDPEIPAQTTVISKPLRTKPHLKRRGTSGIKKTKSRKTTSPLKTLSALQTESVPQARYKVKRLKSTSPRLETKIENAPATRQARSKKSKSISWDFDIKPEKTPGETLVSHTNDPPKAMIDSAEQDQASISKPRGTRSRAKVVQRKEELEIEAREKKQRKQQSKEEAVSVRKQERKKRKAARRVQAGISIAVWPLLSSDRFGLIQEELKGDPFHLIVGTTFLNRTRGSVAIPLLHQFLRDYPTPYALSIAPVQTISTFLQPLGLYNIRATRLHNLAKTWLITPPTFGHVTKKYNYPPRDTKSFPSSLFPINSVEQGRGWEIAHLPGVGAYALDSWRIFCRDEFRRAAGERVEFGQEEWRSVVPMDKELRVYVRWMWAKEGVRWKEPGDIQQTALSSPFFDKAEGGNEMIEIVKESGGNDGI